MGLGELPGYRLAIQGQYDARYADEPRAASRETAAYHARLLEALALPDAGAHLDLGCGAGAFALAVARARPAMRVLGVDLSARAIAMARDEAAQAGLGNVTFEQADAEAPPGGPFRRASALSLFNLLPDKRAALAAWRRVVPDGRLVIADALDTRGAGTSGAGACTEAQLAALCRATGWRVMHREDMTRLIQALNARGAWPWPEYVRAGYRYLLVALE